jgi:hypothetical protein
VKGSVVSEAVPRRAGWRRVAVLVGALLVVALGAAAGRGLWMMRRPLDPPRVKYVSGGELIPLFDATSLNRWESSGGLRVLENDDEKTPVMTLTGIARRRFAPLDAYRLTIGLDPYESFAAEVHFGLPVADTDRGRRYVLRVVNGGQATLGTRDGDRGAFRPLGQSVPVPPASRVARGNRYLGVTIERAGGTWAVSFNSREVGFVPDDGTPLAAELRLTAEEGAARIDTVLLEPLRPAAD